MAWYYGTYSCGHEGRVDIGGPQKDRQRKADWYFSGMCPECAQKKKVEEREKENQAAAERSAEMDLPELSGTEKQIAWANTIRIRQIENFNKRISRVATKLKEKGLEIIPETNIGIKEVIDAVEYYIRANTDARYWIDHRDDITLNEVLKQYNKHMDEVVNADAVKEIRDEESALTACSGTENPKPGVVKIKYDNSLIFAKYVKDDEFRETVKSLGYRWNGEAWEKKITEYTGRAEDRMAELGNKLLACGFTVQFPDKTSMDMAVSGKFSFENDRWVRYSAQTGQLSLSWEIKSDALYDGAKKLPGARWKNGSMKVNIEFYREVEDFAETMGFSISERAREEIERYRAKESGYRAVNVTPASPEEAPDEEKIAKALIAGGSIIEDLIDG